MNKKYLIIFIVLLIGTMSGIAVLLKKNSFSKSRLEIVNEQKEELQNIPAQSENGMQSIEPSGETAPEQEPELIAGPKTETTKPASQNSKSPKPTQPVGEKSETAGSADTDSANVGNIVSKPVSFGFQKSSGRNIKAIIIHTSYNNLGGDPFDFDKVLQEWKDAGVAPHYAIARDGTIFQLVADQNIAWHAGVSKLPDGTTDVNGASIGIEIINDQNSKFSDGEYKALNRLIGDLKEKYAIRYVLGHDDIAPGRKTDPWGIEWGKVKK